MTVSLSRERRIKLFIGGGNGNDGGDRKTRSRARSDGRAGKEDKGVERGGAVAIIRSTPLSEQRRPRSGDSGAEIDIMEGDCALTLFAHRAERVPNAISREFSSRDRSPRAADSHVPRRNRGRNSSTYLGRAVEDRNFNVPLIRRRF